MSSTAPFLPDGDDALTPRGDESFSEAELQRGLCEFEQRYRSAVPGTIRCDA